MGYVCLLSKGLTKLIMKKSLSLIFLLCSILSFTQNTGTIIDSRDGKVYKTVVIGTQTWMIENLNVSTFRNGDPIPEVKTKEEWELAGKEGNPVWCYFDNDPKNGAKYGKLFNWFAVNDPRGLAPSGWHVPTDQEWWQLTDYLGGVSVAGGKMKSTTGWTAPNKEVNNFSGFSGLPGGLRDYSGAFGYIGTEGCWWSSTEGFEGNAWVLGIYSSDIDVDRYDSDKVECLSVRCIKD